MAKDDAKVLVDRTKIYFLIPKSHFTFEERSLIRPSSDLKGLWLKRKRCKETERCFLRLSIVFLLDTWDRCPFYVDLGIIHYVLAKRGLNRANMNEPGNLWNSFQAISTGSIRFPSV